MHLNPNDIFGWMKVETFGIEDPPIHANAVHDQLSSLEFWKKNNFVLYAWPFVGSVKYYE